MEERKLREIQVGTEDIFDGVILNVKRDQVRLPNGHQSVREVIRHVGAVCVVPVTADGKVVVERQYRYPIDQVITEIPAGKLDSKEEDRLHAAKRELMEETGIRVCNIGYYKSQPWGMAQDILTGFFCEADGDYEIRMDENELKYAQWVPRAEIVLQPNNLSLTNEMMSIFKEGKV